ncbi:hypothetical protein [Corynebacterium ulceribovis]|uniref:hypothetical protein n=1 Tax=Corynebacterium ulceribovis TaxID=487732 RepID=UPI00037D071F|nr:hypothetical protein [Corynebacterium ulceribovis]
MLLFALILALVGFFLLTVALWLGQILWAWVCIVVALIGIVLLIIDAVRRRK